jgi:hypothetical protein
MNSRKNSENRGLIEQYFDTNNISINPKKAHYILFQPKQCRQKTELKILIKNRETVNVKVPISLGLKLTVTCPRKYILKEPVAELE